MILYNMEEIYQPTYEERHSCQHGNILIKKMQYFLMQTYTITEESQVKEIIFPEKIDDVTCILLRFQIPLQSVCSCRYRRRGVQDNVILFIC